MPDQSKAKFKIWTATKDAEAGFMVTPEAAVMASNKNFVAVDKIGVHLGGSSLSFDTTSDSIRQGGMFVQMNDFVKMIPGTIVTPIPSQIPFPPLGMIKTVMTDLPIFLAMLV